MNHSARHDQRWCQVPPLKQGIKQGAGNAAAEPGRHRVQSIALLHGMDNVALGEDSAPAGDVGRLAPVGRGPRGEVGNVYAHSFSLLFQKGSRARGAGRVSQMTDIMARRIEIHQKKALAAHHNGIAGRGRQKAHAFDSGQYGIDHSIVRNSRCRQPDCFIGAVRVSFQKGGQFFPETSLVGLIGGGEKCAVFQQSAGDGEGTNVDTKLFHVDSALLCGK